LLGEREGVHNFCHVYLELPLDKASDPRVLSSLW